MSEIERDDERSKRDQARREFNEGWEEAVASANPHDEHWEAETDPSTLRAAIRRLTENHGQLAREYREAGEEIESLRQQLEGAVEARGKMTSALAAVLRLTYDERMPDELADRIRSLVANAGRQ